MDVIVHVGLGNSRARAPACVRAPSVDTTFRELHRLACDAAGVAPSEYRTHYRGKVRDDHETVGDVMKASHAKVALLPNPENAQAKARQQMVEDLEKTRAEQRERWASDARGAAPKTANAAHAHAHARDECGEDADVSADAAIKRSRDAIAKTYETSLSFAEDVAAIERMSDDASALSEKATQQKLLFLNEQCERALLKLDAVDSHGSTEVRTERKAAVRAFNDLCDRITTLKRDR